MRHKINNEQTNQAGLVILIYLSSTSTRRQRKDLFGLRIKLSLVTTSLTTQR